MLTNKIYPYNQSSTVVEPDNVESITTKYLKEYFEALKNEQTRPRMFMMGRVSPPRKSDAILEGLRGIRLTSGR